MVKPKVANLEEETELSPLDETSEEEEGDYDLKATNLEGVTLTG